MISTPSTITCPIQSSSPEPSLPSPLQPLLADKESKVPKEKQVTRNGQVEERRGYSGTQWHWARLFHKRPLQWDIDNIVRDGSTEAKRQKLVLFGCLMLMLIVHQQYRQREKERLIKDRKTKRRDHFHSTMTTDARRTRTADVFLLPATERESSLTNSRTSQTHTACYSSLILSCFSLVIDTRLFCFSFLFFFWSLLQKQNLNFSHGIRANEG